MTSPTKTVPSAPVEVTPPDITEIKPAPGTGQLPLDVFTPEKKAEPKTHRRKRLARSLRPELQPSRFEPTYNVAPSALGNAPGI